MTSGAADREGGRDRGFVRTAVAVFAAGLFDAAVAFGASFLVLGAMIVLWAFGPFWAGQVPGENGGPGFGLVLGGILVGTFALPVALWVVLLTGWWAIARRGGERLAVTETSSGSP